MNDRRRLQFLFNNPQSMIDGLSIGYVQTSKGNLTFERRDLVVLGAKAVIASRIYDSHRARNSGFGPGWRLNLDESIQVRDNHVVYIAGSGARYRFTPTSRVEYQPSLSTPGMHDVRLSILGTLAILQKRDGSVSYFQSVKERGQYVLVRKTTMTGSSIVLNYDDRKLTGVAHDGEPVLTIKWSGDRIVSIGDMYNRHVTYSYDSRGRLAAATDLGRQSWTYAYDRTGRLIAAAHPDGEPYLHAEYDVDGRVSRSTTVRDFEFRYHENATTVTESDGNRHHVKHNDLGITVGYHNERDLQWNLVLDAQNRPVELEKQGAVYRFHYQGSNLMAIDHPYGSQWLHYDSEDRYTHASGVTVSNHLAKQVKYQANGATTITDGPRTWSYTRDASQRVESIIDQSVQYHITYDSRGFVDGMSRENRSVVFTRNRLGRVTDIRDVDGNSSRYHYDTLGNRDVLDYANGARMTLKHDGRGNIVQVTEVTSDGTSITQSYQIDSYNRIRRVQFLNSIGMDVSYDLLGRPAEFQIDDHVIQVEYLGDGEAIGLRSGQSTYPLDSKQSDGVLQSLVPSPRAFLHNDLRSHSQPPYGVLFIQPQRLDAVIVPIEIQRVPGYQLAQDALFTARSYTIQEGRQRMERPSNPIFQPPEYESTNCCLACAWDSTCGQYCTTFYGTGELTCLCGSYVDPSTLPNGGGSNCSPEDDTMKATARQVVTDTLLAADYAPYEEAFRNDCPDPNQIDASWASDPYVMCIKLTGIANRTIYLGHTHPKFEWTRDQHQVAICSYNDEKTRLEHPTRVNQLNTMNEDCSIRDNNVGNSYPLLLRTPSGRIKKCGSK